MNLINFLFSFFSGGVGAKIGHGISTGVQIAALAPVALWFLQEKDNVAVSLTWGQLALIGGILFFVVKVVRFTPQPPQQFQRPLPPAG